MTKKVEKDQFKSDLSGEEDLSGEKTILHVHNPEILICMYIWMK